MKTHRPRRGLAASLIVRDEAQVLAGCLISLIGIVDEIHVHDTGSTDGTAELAAELGARVTRGSWSDDFAAARNAALVGWSCDWVLCIDADERVVADAPALRELLDRTSHDALRVEIDNVEDTGGFTHQMVRLFRPARARWEGRVHERVVARGDLLHADAAPRELIRLSHSGYQTAVLLQSKGVRNAALAQAALDDMAAPGADPDHAQVAKTMLDLGRSLMAADRAQDAVDTFEALREMFPGTPEWIRATDYLARLLLAAGLYDAGLLLSEQLRAAGAGPSYCDWLAVQALVQLGMVEEAWVLLSGIDDVIDTLGCRLVPSTLRTLVDLVAQLRRAHAESKA